MLRRGVDPSEHLVAPLQLATFPCSTVHFPSAAVFLSIGTSWIGLRLSVVCQKFARVRPTGSCSTLKIDVASGRALRAARQ